MILILEVEFFISLHSIARRIGLRIRRTKRIRTDFEIGFSTDFNSQRIFGS